MQIDSRLQELAEISRRYGADRSFVLAGGGNTSFKTADRLWVKASGHTLATIQPDGFVELDRQKLEAMLNASWPIDPHQREAAFIEALMNARTQPHLSQRPSVEALLHHLIPSQFVVHTHPEIVNAFTCCAQGESLIAELFGDEFLWQPYVDPGLVLAGELRRALFQRGQNRAIFLANHGLIVAADHPDEIERVSKRIIHLLRERLGTTASSFDATFSTSAGKLDACVKMMNDPLQPIIDSSEPIRTLVGISAGKQLAMSGPLTPDQIVYCRSVPLWIESPDEFQNARQQYVAAHGFKPWVVLIAGAGMIAVRETMALAKLTRDLYVDAAAIYVNALRLGGVRTLNPRDRKFIEDWEVESYRRKVAELSAK